MQQQIASLRDELSKKEQALRSITGKVSVWSVFDGIVVLTSDMETLRVVVVKEIVS